MSCVFCGKESRIYYTTVKDGVYVDRQACIDHFDEYIAESDEKIRYDIAKLIAVHKCIYDRAWVGYCGNQVEPNNVYCNDHKHLRCTVCGENATKECSETYGLVCGRPLCDTCECTCREQLEENQLNKDVYKEDKVTHTPTPYAIHAVDINDIFGINKDKLCRIARCKSRFLAIDENIANAKFIVKACNNYDDLLEACKRFAERPGIAPLATDILFAKLIIAKCEEEE